MGYFCKEDEKSEKVTPGLTRNYSPDSFSADQSLWGDQSRLMNRHLGKMNENFSHFLSV